MRGHRRSAIVVVALLAGGSACIGEIEDGPGAGYPDAGDPGGPDAGDLGQPDAMLPPGDPIGSFQITYYWVTTEEEFTGPKDAELYDSSCNVLATVDGDFADSLALEGTGRLADGRLLNYWDGCPCPTSPCFFEVGPESPWGVGVQGYALEPFRSIAVDTGVLSIGTTYYIADLDGLHMPGDGTIGGFTHDGCVIAADVGGALDGSHVDFFAALRPYYVELVNAIATGSVMVHDGGERCAPLAH